MKIFEKSEWIWLSAGQTPDSYAEFRDVIPYEGGQVCLRLSCDTDYTLYVNGQFAASNQYGDFEHYKIYDTLDITPHLVAGENRIDILVYYCGVDTQRYRKAAAGLIYEVVSDDRILSYSREGIPSRLSPTYENGKCLLVTSQLGFTFAYDTPSIFTITTKPSWGRTPLPTICSASPGGIWRCSPRTPSS